jgi:drug/metabolite transporter (DMT)-like permease
MSGDDTPREAPAAKVPPPQAAVPPRAALPGRPLDAQLHGPPSPPVAPVRCAWFFNPYLQLTLGVLANTAAELFERQGARATQPATQAIFGITALASIWTWCGIGSYILGFLSWIYVLRFVPLGIAFTLINGGVQVLVPLGAHLILHEPMNPQRWCAVAMVAVGIVLIAQAVARAEEKL